MIEPRKRDTTADSPDWVYLGEFFRGIGMRDRIRLAVYRSTADHTLHRLTASPPTSRPPPDPASSPSSPNRPTTARSGTPPGSGTRCVPASRPEPARSPADESPQGREGGTGAPR